MICLEEVELVHGWTLEVGTSYMVLILVADIEDALVCGEKILALVERVQVLLQLIKSEKRRIRHGHWRLLHLFKKIILHLLSGTALRDE